MTRYSIKNDHTSHTHMQPDPAGDWVLYSECDVVEMLFAIEAALPFVKSYVGSRSCSSAGGPVALEAILKKHDWDNRRWKYVPIQHSAA